MDEATYIFDNRTTTFGKIFVHHKKHLLLPCIVKDVPLWESPDETSIIIAHAMNRRSFDHDFINWLLPHYTTGKSVQDTSLLVHPGVQSFFDLNSCKVWNYTKIRSNGDSQTLSDILQAMRMKQVQTTMMRRKETKTTTI